MTLLAAGLPEIVPQAGALALMFSVLVWLATIQRRVRQDQDARIDALERENEVCRRRLTRLTNALILAGIPIPEETP